MILTKPVTCTLTFLSAFWKVSGLEILSQTHLKGHLNCLSNQERPDNAKPFLLCFFPPDSLAGYCTDLCLKAGIVVWYRILVSMAVEMKPFELTSTVFKLGVAAAVVKEKLPSLFPRPLKHLPQQKSVTCFAFIWLKTNKKLNQSN